MLLFRPTGWPLPVRAVIGSVVVVLVLVVADRRKWGRMETTFAFTDDVATMRAVADHLVARGVPVTLDVESWGPRLRYRNRDAKRVHAALVDLGLRGPEFR
jgi:Flp pilus assembly CpaF family ATPase